MPPQFGAAFRDDLATLLTWRRDVRHFRTDPIEEALVAELLALAQCAPSVGNSQPWRFVRLRSPEIRAALVDHVEHESSVAGAAMGGAARNSGPAKSSPENPAMDRASMPALSASA